MKATDPLYLRLLSTASYWAVHALLAWPIVRWARRAPR